MVDFTAGTEDERPIPRLHGFGRMIPFKKQYQCENCPSKDHDVMLDNQAKRDKNQEKSAMC